MVHIQESEYAIDTHQLRSGQAKTAQTVMPLDFCAHRLRDSTAGDARLTM